jgi:hypothetical protein
MKKRSWTLYALPAVLAAGTLAAAGAAYASNEIARETGLVCTACHDKPGSRLLTDRGKYYELMGDLAGFEEIGKAFGRCTTCHAKRPGSKKLTAEGRRLARAIENMDALRELVLKEHPELPPAEGTAPGEHRAAAPRVAPAAVPPMPAH